ncbi:MAG: protein kinase [Ruminococcus sp.]|nr:protein kinase [Ruminococcus sp.]
MDPREQLCMGCMNELDPSGQCQYCSYTENIPHLQAYLAPKTVLDNRYIIGKMLSYNGEGASYICYDMVGKCKCVCREYMPDTLCERDSSTQELVVNKDCLAKYKTFMSEFADVNRTLSKMRNLHHIATARDMFNANNTTYVILEYVEGVSLKKFLQSNSGFLSWEQVKKLFVPLFTTLSIIHNAGIIHRGISPENIIVTTDGELKLTGFCISSIRTSNTGLLPEFYSGYTAPEQYSSLEWQGTWTDVYALAAVLYRILTGTMPLDAQTRTKNDTMVEPARINPRISPHISRVIAKAMAVRGEERIQTVTELVSALFEQRPRQHIEMEKGSTQTIPVQHIPRSSRERQGERRPANKPVNQAKVKKKSTAAIIVSWVFIAVILALCIFLLYLLLSGPSEKSTSSSSSVRVIDFSKKDSKTDSSSKADAQSSQGESSEAGLGEGAIVPKMTGVRLDVVKQQIGDNFTLKIDWYFSDTDERNVVVAQSIPEGESYDPSKKPELVLKVCSGPENVAVPAYYGLDQKSYLDLLNEWNIKYKVTEMRGTQTAGSVIGTSIYPGNKINVKNGDVLIVYVSDGKETVTTTEKVTETQSETKQEPVQSETKQTKQTQTAANTEKSQPAPEE